MNSPPHAGPPLPRVVVPGLVPPPVRVLPTCDWALPFFILARPQSYPVVRQSLFPIHNLATSGAPFMQVINIMLPVTNCVPSRASECLRFQPPHCPQPPISILVPRTSMGVQASSLPVFLHWISGDVFLQWIWPPSGLPSYWLLRLLLVGIVVGFASAGSRTTHSVTPIWVIP